MDNKKQEIQEIIQRWTNQSEVLLRCGEMEAQELRTTMAALRAFARELETVINAPLPHLSDYVGSDETP